MSTKKVNPTSDTKNSDVNVTPRGAGLVPERETADEHVDELAPILSLPPKMQRFIHLYSTGQYTLQKLAQLLEVHPNTLGLWLKKSDVKAILYDMQEATHDVVATQLKAMTAKAASKLNDLIESPIDGVALQAVKDVLDRAGHKPQQQIKIDKTVTTIEQKMSDLIDRVIIDVDGGEVE